MVHSLFDPGNLSAFILEMEKRGIVTRTFRRLDPDRQAAVIASLFDEGVERGPAGITIRGVASRAGVSSGSLYQYFPDRRAVMDFAVALGVKLMTDMIAEGAAYAPRMKLDEFLSMYLTYGVDLGADFGGFLRFFGRAAYGGESGLAETVVSPVSEGMLDAVRSALEAARERGELVDGVDGEACARILNALFTLMGDVKLLPHLNAYFRLYDDAVSPERILAAALDLVRRGVLRPHLDNPGAGPVEGTP